MIKLTYIDGKTDDLMGANAWRNSTDNDGNSLGDDNNCFIDIVERSFDKEGEYDESEDKVVATVSADEIRKIEKC